MKSSAHLKAFAWLQLITAGGLSLYWMLFFSVGLAPTAPPQGYFAFQHSFTFADILLSLAFVRAGLLLLSHDVARRNLGCALSRICSSALLFLGLLDVSFNLQNGIYAIVSLDMIIEIAINVWCIGFASCWLLGSDPALLSPCKNGSWFGSLRHCVRFLPAS